MSRINPLDFRINDINISNLDSIQIENVSIGRSFGRRFTIKCGTKKSEELLFRSVLKRVQKLAKHERNLENLEAIKVCLEKLKKVEEDAIKLFNKQSFIYKMRTCIHRIFFFDDHLKTIKDLINTNQHCLDVFDLNKNLKALDHLPADKKDKKLVHLVSFYLNSHNIGPAFVVCREISNQNLKDAALAFIGHFCLDENDTASAVIATALIGVKSQNPLFILFELKQSNPERDPLLKRLANIYIDRDELLKAHVAANELCQNNPDRTPLLVLIANKYLTKNDLDTALEVNATINDPTIKNAFIEKIIHMHLQSRDFNEAFKAVKTLDTHHLKKDALLEKIRKASFENKDLTCAIEVNRFISDSQSKEAFVVKVVNHYESIKDLPKAIATAKLLKDTGARDLLLVKFRNAYFVKNDFKTALDVNKAISDHDLNTEFVSLIANLYIKANQLREAFSISESSALHRYKKDSLYSEIAKAYFMKNDFENTFKTISSMSIDSLKAHDLRINLTQALLEKDMLQDALRASKLICFPVDQERMLIKIAEAYFDKNDLVRALDVAKTLSDGSLNKQELVAKIEYRNSWVGYFFG